MPKNMNQAILEAIQGEMRRDKLLTLLYEYQKPGNLEKEFGPWRVRFRIHASNSVSARRLGIRKEERTCVMRDRPNSVGSEASTPNPPTEMSLIQAKASSSLSVAVVINTPDCSSALSWMRG